MFCPNCATENSNVDVKFCRSCGKDLRLVSQAMVKRIGWTTVLATKLDDFFMSKSQRNSREEILNGLSNILLGICLLGLGIWNILTHDGLSAFTGFLFVTALLSLGIGVGSAWVHKRRLNSDAYREAERLPDDLSIFKQDFAPTAKQKLPSVKATKETSKEPVAESARPSITEHTTIPLQKRDE